MAPQRLSSRCPRCLGAHRPAPWDFGETVLQTYGQPTCPTYPTYRVPAIVGVCKLVDLYILLGFSYTGPWHRRYPSRADSTDSEAKANLG
ncbi:hypothetical protein NADFUDRAFT_84563 [Nadsonia fulvescens var. elongata DSM 6958]|uniref:Uncharacterized protein n=1 Tax=Nadsonia fulvescens var. elongata DSM 6958 TaxID=857566 RepID=A0A1E3PCE7_9ASCO|nr:hypothetical protein NADFUDRAFT_84563 [Nadsonia fulvescens var. elongata DSM 6958]